MEGPDPIWIIAALRDELRAKEHYIAILEWRIRYLEQQVAQCDLACEILSPTRIDS